MAQRQDQKPRWMYRFDNYKRAFCLLREAIEIKEARALTQLEKEGVIQRFEYTWELAWKLIKYYLAHEGVVLDKITPASVVRAAFAAKLIKDGELWMQALDDRNKMSHVYSFQEFENVIDAIQNTYLTLFDDLHLLMMDNIVNDEDNAQEGKMSKHGLQPKHIEMIASILKPYADQIKVVGLFGSRAQGTYRNNSDIDMAIDGTLSAKDIDRLYTQFDESLLPYQVDVNALNLIDYQPLKDHIESVFYPLLTQDDLNVRL